MATSRIRLYKVPDLKEENNYIIEELATTYLAGNYFGMAEITGFQFQRLESTKTIKIDASQLINTPIPVDGKSYNYCVIWQETSNGAIATGRGAACYFVQAIQQEAKSTIKLYLKLDVLNTFYDTFKTRMTAGTYIARGHEERFKTFFTTGTSPSVNLCLVNQFNRVSEGDSLQLEQSISDKKTIYETLKGDTEANPLKFYLVYRNAEDGRPCIDLCANRQLLLSGYDPGTGTVEFDYSDLVQGRYYYMLGDFTFSYYFEEDIGGGMVQPKWSDPISVTNGIIQYYRGQTGLGQNYISISVVSGSTVNKYVADLAKIRIIKGRKIYYSNIATLLDSQISHFDYSTISAGDYPAAYLGDINQLDRTSDKIAKVIECPYCPISYSYNSVTGVYTFDDTIFDSESDLEYPKYLRTYNVGKELPKREIGSISSDFYSHLRQYKELAAVQALANAPAVSAFLDDPKIYTSPYYVFTLSYDSFAKQVKYEDFEYISTNTTPSDSLRFFYKQSANVSSALLFEFYTDSDYIDPYGFALKKSEENFPRVLAASRNNELALFSDAYLNYIRNGYNYDKKKQAEDVGFQGAMAALQTVGSVISFALSGVTGGASALAGAGLAVGAASTFANMGYSAYRSGEEISQKINLLKAQSFSVSGVDDLELFNEYGKNKLQVLLYKVKPNDLNRIKTRFQYFGYAVDKYANPYPFYFDGRHNFNYLKCDPLFRFFDVAPIPEDFLEEIAEKMRAGVTIWHKRYYTKMASYQYELNRDFENMEESIMEGIINL